MTKYLETYTHMFDNSDDIYEHLLRDTLNFAKIEKQLKRAGMISAT